MGSFDKIKITPCSGLAFDKLKIFIYLTNCFGKPTEEYLDLFVFNMYNLVKNGKIVITQNNILDLENFATTLDADIKSEDSSMSLTNNDGVYFYYWLGANYKDICDSEEGFKEFVEAWELTDLSEVEKSKVDDMRAKAQQSHVQAQVQQTQTTVNTVVSKKKTPAKDTLADNANAMYQRLQQEGLGVTQTQPVQPVKQAPQQSTKPGVKCIMDLVNSGQQVKKDRLAEYIDAQCNVNENIVKVRLYINGAVLISKGTMISPLTQDSDKYDKKCREDLYSNTFQFQTQYNILCLDAYVAESLLYGHSFKGYNSITDLKGSTVSDYLLQSITMSTIAKFLDDSLTVVDKYKPTPYTNTDQPAQLPPIKIKPKLWFYGNSSTHSIDICGVLVDIDSKNKKLYCNDKEVTPEEIVKLTGKGLNTLKEIKEFRDCFDV